MVLKRKHKKSQPGKAPCQDFILQALRFIPTSEDKMPVITGVDILTLLLMVRKPAVKQIELGRFRLASGRVPAINGFKTSSNAPIPRCEFFKNAHILSCMLRFLKNLSASGGSLDVI
jgi:hypothetical protein